MSLVKKALVRAHEVEDIVWVTGALVVLVVEGVIRSLRHWLRGWRALLRV